MPNPAQKPDYSKEDIDHLVDAFQESGVSEQERKSRAEAIEAMIEEALVEDERKEKEKRVERTGIIYTEAAKAAADVLKDNLGMAMQMAETPEAAVLLIQPVQERLQKSLDPAGGFSKLHEDPKIQQLYKVFTDKIRHEAVSAVKTELQKWIDTAQASSEKSRLQKLMETVEASDPGGDKE